MTDVGTVALALSIIEFFILGLWIGGALASRENPNEPKPRHWDDKLREAWEKGFKSGEKSMMRRMSSKLKDEELLAEYNSRFRKGE